MSLAIVSNSNDASSQAWERAAITSSNVQNTIGFIQDKNGKIVKINGASNFTSTRNINAIFASYDASRVANVVSLSEVKLENFSLIKGRHFTALPPELRALLNSGTILVTSAHRNASNFSIMAELGTDLRLCTFDFIKADLEINKKNPQTLKPEYSILHYSFGEDNTQGRSGVLLNAATKEPVIVTINQREYVVEIKGCGLGTGGFGQLGTRSEEPSIPGAVMPVYARKEINNLDQELQPEGCKSGCAVIGNINGNEIGYILRLSPSTVRASYSDNLAFPNTKEVATEIAKAYAQLFIEQISCRSPYLLLGPHHENILVSSNNNFSWTDYSDHVSLGANDSQFNTIKGFKQLVSRLFQGFQEVPGANIQELVNFINLEAKNSGIPFQLNTQNNISEHVELIWKEYLANKVWEARLSEQFKLFTNGLFTKIREFDSDAWSDLQKKYEDLAKNLINEEGLAPSVPPLLEKLAAAFKQNRFHDIYSLIDSLHKIDMNISMKFIEVIDPLRKLDYFQVVDTLSLERQFIEDLIAINQHDPRYVAALSELEDIEKAVYNIFNSGLECVDKLKTQGTSILQEFQPKYYSIS